MLLFLVGLLAILCQIVLLRELNVAFYGVELVYGIALAGWMAGSAAGAAFVPRRIAVTGARLAWLLAIAAAALPGQVALIRASRLMLGGIPGAFLPFGQQLLVLAASVLPQSIVLGLAFRWAAQLAAARGRPLARSYAVESVGAVVGALAATMAFALGMQTFTLAVLTAGVVPTLLLAVRAMAPGSTAQQGPLVLPAILLLVATAVAARLAPRVDLLMTGWSHPAVIETRDSPYARVTATVSGSQTALFLDDVLVYESETAQHEELAHVAALQHPAPRRILLLGGSVEGLEHELRRHGPERFDVVELDRTYFDVADRRLQLRSTAVFDDPRDFLRRGAEYDLIVVAMPQPTSGQSNRFYTAEFFAECRQRMADGGVLGFRLVLPENLVTPLLALRTASVVAAARSVFPFVEVLQGSSALVLASAAPLPGSADVLIDRWHARGLATRLVTPAYLHYLYENDRRAEMARLRTIGAVPNSDARPVCYQFAAVNWLARFYPGLLRVDPAIFATWVVGRGDRGAVAACVIVLFALARRWPAARTALLAGAAGFSGMLLESVLLLAYQARSGALYERLGILLMAFMAGLALGAWLGGRVIALDRGLSVARRALVALFVTSSAIGAAIAMLVVSGAPMGLAVTGLLLFSVGALVAGIFACVAALSHGEGGAAIGRLYGADLAGGALGSLLASLVLVPMAGLVPTTWVVVGLSAIALLLV
ncbi:MAG TPA: hypothetical protein VF332_06525 [Vicinamibacterales bacterium]